MADDPYPITSRFIADVPDWSSPIAKTFAGVVKDYEHGVAETEDVCAGTTVEIYAEVALDLLRSLEP